MSSTNYRTGTKEYRTVLKLTALRGLNPWFSKKVQLSIQPAVRLVQLQV